MPQNWKTYNLGEVANIKYGKDHKKLEEGTYPCYGTGGIMRFVDKYLSKEESVLIPRKGSLNNIYYINKPFWTVDTLFWTQVNAELIFPKYLYYNFKTVDFASKDVGSAVPSLTTSLLNGIELKIPPLQEQIAIASILSALDDKIELNLQMNKTLEEMAMALYKHWFVDFGPFQKGEFVDSELGMIPKGWEVKPIGDLIETLGGGTPKTSVNEYWEDGTIEWYSPTDLTKANSLYSLGSAKKITGLGLQKSSAKIFPKGSLLMSSRATIGAITINRNDACTNQGFITMIPNQTLSLFQLHGWTVQNMDLIISKANGSTFKEISKTNFRNLPITVGFDVQPYLDKSKGIYSQIENNILENQTLTTLRDTLLPKLISGEVRVKDAEKLITAAL